MAATTRTWYGRTPGSEGNWGTAANFIPSGVPVDTDTVIFDNGNQSVTSGLNQASISLVSLYVRESYRGNIGTAGAPLIIAATNIILKGSGTEYHIEPDDCSIGVIALPRGGATTCHFGGPVAKISTLYISGGNVTIQPGTVITRLHVTAGNAPLPHVTLQNGLDFITSTNVYIMLDDGTVVMDANQSGATNVNIMQSGGRLIVNNAARNIWVSGGVLEHVAGLINMLYLRGGLYDAGLSTIPRTINSLYATNESTVNLRTGVGAVTVGFTFKAGHPVFVDEEA